MPYPLRLEGAARPGRPARCPDRGGAPARGAAHHLPQRRGRAAAGDRAGRSVPAAGGRPRGPARAGSGPGGGDAWRGARPRGRSISRRGRCSAPPCCGSVRSEHVLLLDHAPHRLRRLVDGGAAARAGGALRGLRGGAAVAAARAAGAVRRLRGLAAAVAERRGAGAAARLLAARSSPARRPVSTCRPTARARRCRRSTAPAPLGRAAGRPDRGAAGALPAARG